MTATSHRFRSWYSSTTTRRYSPRSRLGSEPSSLVQVEHELRSQDVAIAGLVETKGAKQWRIDGRRHGRSGLPRGGQHGKALLHVVELGRQDATQVFPHNEPLLPIVRHPRSALTGTYICSALHQYPEGECVQRVHLGRSSAGCQRIHDLLPKAGCGGASERETKDLVRRHTVVDEPDNVL